MPTWGRGLKLRSVGRDRRYPMVDLQSRHCRDFATHGRHRLVYPPSSFTTVTPFMLECSYAMTTILTTSTPPHPSPYRSPTAPPLTATSPWTTPSAPDPPRAGQRQYHPPRAPPAGARASTPRSSQSILPCWRNARGKRLPTRMAWTAWMAGSFFFSLVTIAARSSLFD